MRVLIVAVGSRGDAEPFCALAEELCDQKGEVDLFLQRDLQYLMEKRQDQGEGHASQVTNSNLRIHDLPFTQMDFYQFVDHPSHGAHHENPRVRFLGVVTDVIGEVVLPCLDQVFKQASSVDPPVDVIVTSSLARPLAMAVGTKLNIPVGVVHLQPLCPNGKFPHYSRTDQCLEAIVGNSTDSSAAADFYGSYWELEKYQHEFLQDRLDMAYKKLHLSPLRWTEDLRKALTGRDDGRTLIFNAYLDELIPSIIGGNDLVGEERDIAPTVFDVGPLADEWCPKNAPTLESNEELVAFLRECEDKDDSRPVCVGFGSMPFNGVSNVVDALLELNQRAILVGDALKIKNEEISAKSTELFHVSSVPYSQLLPRCSLMLCHGGAGVVNATLRAGIPCVISPLMGDQFFHAKLLEHMNLGAQAGKNLATLTKEEIVEGIRHALSPSCISKAQVVGERIRSRSKNGVQQMVDILKQQLCTK